MTFFLIIQISNTLLCSRWNKADRYTLHMLLTQCLGRIKIFLECYLLSSLSKTGFHETLFLPTQNLLSILKAAWCSFILNVSKHLHVPGVYYFETW